VVTVGGKPSGEAKLEQIRKGAKSATNSSFRCAAFITASCVLHPREKITDERVIDETGSWVMCELHFFYEIWKQSGEKDDLIPPYFANVWSGYLERVKNFSLPENARHRQIHDGHLVYVQPEERIRNARSSRASCIVGTPEEVAQLRTIEEAGIRGDFVASDGSRAQGVPRFRRAGHARPPLGVLVRRRGLHQRRQGGARAHGRGHVVTLGPVVVK
jgi:hypothetical protein